MDDKVKKDQSRDRLVDDRFCIGFVYTLCCYVNTIHDVARTAQRRRLFRFTTSYSSDSS